MKPYEYFRNVGDIHAPMNTTVPDASLKPDESQKTEVEDAKESVTEEVEPCGAEPEPSTSTEQLYERMPAIVDEDTELKTVERILLNIHALFYKYYDEEKTVSLKASYDKENLRISRSRTRSRY